jgi:hypothetical protein
VTVDDDVSVGSLQRRAGQHAGFMSRAPSIDFLRDLTQPWQPICICERRAALHLFHVLGGMQIVAFLKLAP